MSPIRRLLARTGWTRSRVLSRVRTMTVRVGPFNVPESGKRGLIRNRRKRARGVLRELRENLIGVASLHETGPNLKRAARFRPRWRTVFAPPNSYAWGTWQANALIVQRFWFRVLDTDHITVHGLNLPVALIRHRRTGYQFAAIGLHAPRWQDDPDGRTRAAIKEAIRDYVRDLDGIPCVVMGDANDGTAYAWDYRPLLFRAHRHGVDWIMQSGHFAATHPDLIRAPRLSDHAWPFVRLSVWWLGNQRPVRLPR